MTAVRELVAALVAAGHDPVEAAAMVARASIEMISPQKSSGAVRQQRYRERHKASQNVTPLRSDDEDDKASQSVTKRHNVTVGDDAPISNSNSSSKNSLGTSPTKASRGTRLPDDWTPGETDRAAARAEGFTDSEIEREIPRFRDHWIAQPGAKGVKLDWPATFRNWMRRAAEMRGKQPQSQSAPQSQISRGEWEKQVDRFRRGMAWTAKHWGPEPGQLGCRAPPDILQKHGFRPEA